jgi:hypothetical protein
MYQVYLLSIVANLLAGIALAFDRLDERLHVGSFFNRDAFTSQSFRLVLGLITAGVGFFQLLTVHPEDVVFVGDLIPAITGLALGAILLLEYYEHRSESSAAGTTERAEGVRTDGLRRVLLGNAATFGMLGILVALLHFILHRFLFL